MKPTAFIASLLLFISACQKETDSPVTVSTFREHGLDCSWDPAGSDRIVYSMKGEDGYYDIHTALPNGSNDVCLTCNSTALPNRHISNPAWHPSGKWIVFIAEKANHPGNSTDALPGFGAYNDIWLMNDSGTVFYKLVDIPNDYDHGVICPRFSPDGHHLVWTDRKQAPNPLDPKKTAGYWFIKSVPFGFDANNQPVLGPVVKTYEPGGEGFYECYGYSPDNSRLIFCSNMNMPSFWDEHIYTIDTNGSSWAKLTDKDYNEHGFYKPDGSKILWMSNTQSSVGGTDWWEMNTDGSAKRRLTFFNQPNHIQYAGHAVWAGLGSFAPDGHRFVGGVQQDLISQEGKIVIIEYK